MSGGNNIDKYMDKFSNIVLFFGISTSFLFILLIFLHSLLENNALYCSLADETISMKAMLKMSKTIHITATEIITTP